MSDPQSIVVRAYAKINLALSVAAAEPAEVGGRPHPLAGYHRLASWMAMIDLHDRVEGVARPAGMPSEYRVVWDAEAPKPTPIDWPATSDLSARAHRALESLVGRELPVKVLVSKRVPVGAGMGGGSSDAAATMRGVCKAHGLKLDDAALRSVAKGLGSDVPFFLGPSPAAVIEGFGEVVTPTLPVGGRLIAVVPPVACPTPSVYKAFDRLGVAKSEPESERVRALASSGVLDPMQLFNDLQGAAMEVAPSLAGVVRALEEASGSRVMLTGSGSAMLVFAGDNPAMTLTRIERARSGGDARLAGCVAVMCRLLGEGENA